MKPTPGTFVEAAIENRLDDPVLTALGDATVALRAGDEDEALRCIVRAAHAYGAAGVPPLATVQGGPLGDIVVGRDTLAAPIPASIDHVQPGPDFSDLDRLA